MNIYIAADGGVELRDSDDFSAFAIVEAQRGAAATALAGIGVPAEAGHYWLDANAVLELSGRRENRQWADAYWTMLSKAEKFGYADMTRKRVKAHVDQAE